MTADKVAEQKLFEFLTENQDTITTATATRLIAEFGASFDLDDI